jgi:heme/copper-type cytochrome/quinol oxidase subunit 2
MFSFLGAALAQVYGSEPLDTLANVGEPAYTAGSAALARTNLAVTVATILNTVFSLLGIVFVVLFVYAGFLWMTAAGNETQIEKAKKIMTGAVIGLGIMLASYAISKFVTAELLRATNPTIYQQ